MPRAYPQDADDAPWRADRERRAGHAGRCDSCGRWADMLGHPPASDPNALLCVGCAYPEHTP